VRWLGPTGCRRGGCPSLWPATATRVTPPSSHGHAGPSVRRGRRHRRSSSGSSSCASDSWPRATTRGPRRSAGTSSRPGRRSTATILRKLHRAGLVTPQPHERPRSFYVRFAAELPNETWQADFTHRRRRRARRDPGRVGAPRALLERTTAPSLEVDGAREPGLKAIRERSQRVPPHHRATNTTRGVAERNPPL
jgi:hypothetical protein